MICPKCGYAAYVSKKECPACHGRGKTFDPNVTHMMWPPPPVSKAPAEAKPETMPEAENIKRPNSRAGWPGIWKPLSVFFLAILPDKSKKQSIFPSRRSR